jgi:hypothetical protein
VSVGAAYSAGLKAPSAAASTAVVKGFVTVGKKGLCSVEKKAAWKAALKVAPAVVKWVV